jgi:hypothetical protein
MSADVLRRAAEQIRVDSGNRYARELISKRHYDYELAVADWLDRAAHLNPFGDAADLERFPGSEFAHAMSVARAYLGGSA